MSKQVPFGTRPATKPPVAAADDWVQTREPAGNTLKRLTIDIPEGLHRRLKLLAAGRGVNMADLVRQWIELGVDSQP